MVISFPKGVLLRKKIKIKFIILTNNKKYVIINIENEREVTKMYTYTKTITVTITPKEFTKIKKIYEDLTGVEEKEFDKPTFECWLEDYLDDYNSDQEFFEDFEKTNVKIEREVTKDE